MTYYTNNKKLRQLILDYRSNGTSAELVETIQKIAYGRIVRQSPWLIGHPDMDDYTAEAVYRVFKNLDRIDLDKNIFAYLTEVCYNAFAQAKRRERPYRRWESLSSCDVNTLPWLE